MPVVCYEQPESPVVTGKDAKRTYVVHGTDDEVQAIYKFMATAPVNYIGLIRDNETMVCSNVAKEVWRVECTWVKPPEPPEDEPGDGEGPPLTIVQFDTTGSTQHITQAISQVDYGPNARPDIRLSRAIRVNEDSVEGVDIIVPQMSFTVKMKYDQDEFGVAEAVLIKDKTAKTNLDWVSIGGMLFAPGELLFEGGRGGLNGEDADAQYEIEYVFRAEQNRQNFQVSPQINVASKKGHEYLWVLYRRDEADNKFVQTPDTAFVAKVYEETTLNGVFGF